MDDGRVSVVEGADEDAGDVIGVGLRIGLLATSGFEGNPLFPGGE